MIISKLYGGLANQMFQYAAGSSLAARNNSTLYLDTSWFDEIKGNKDVVQREYELDGFGIVPKRIKLIDKVSLKLSPIHIFKEDGFSFQEDFDYLSSNTLLDGYWQSYKYFINNEGGIRQSFKFPDAMTRENKEILKDISKHESVSIHVRRGDYNTAKGKQFHGLIPLSYYREATARIHKNIKQPRLFVFSDDIEWCIKNVRLDFPTRYIDSNGPSSGVEDMRLMTACKHNVIANSSFSWWAGWLNPNPTKIVIAPKRWFVDRAIDTKDLIPPEWQRI